MVQNIIAIGKNFGMVVLAEGVESSEHFAILKDCGCDLMQGYYFSRLSHTKSCANILLPQSQFKSKQSLWFSSLAVLVIHRYNKTKGSLYWLPLDRDQYRYTPLKAATQRIKNTNNENKTQYDLTVITTHDCNLLPLLSATLQMGAFAATHIQRCEFLGEDLPFRSS